MQIRWSETCELIGGVGHFMVDMVERTDTAVTHIMIMNNTTIEPLRVLASFYIDRDDPMNFCQQMSSESWLIQQDVSD